MNLDDIMHNSLLSPMTICCTGVMMEKRTFSFLMFQQGKIFKLNETSFTILESFSEDLSFCCNLRQRDQKFSIEKSVLIKDLSGLMEKWTESGVLIENE